MSRIGPVSRLCPTVSVVIATANRRHCLPNCIASLRRQTYRPLELVVVVGPSQDGSHDYASSLTDAKVTRVDRLNASHARNTGVRLASGDIIAFIDDDAIATPTWLEELVRVFQAEGPTCGGVAGLVVNENGSGRPVQAMNNTINDLGEPVERRLAPSGFNDPEGDEFVYFMGANMAMRRDAIFAAGGFDETYFYPYEDADLSVAVIKAGYRLFHHPRALVHHFPAPSHNRRGPFDPGYYAAARHQMYFVLKFSRRTNWECFREVVQTKHHLIRKFIQMSRAGQIRHRDAARFTWNTIKGVTSGLRAGLRYRREGRVPSLLQEHPRPEFRTLTMDPLPRPPRRRQRQSLRVALLCGEFGGPNFGGVGVYTAHLAEALASRGHDVTVFRTGVGRCRIKPAGYRVVDVPLDWDPVRERHAFLMALHREADRREFDLVESPLWAGNGAAVGSAARWPLVVRLETPFALIREMSGIEYNHGVKTLIAAEQLQLAYATGIIGISEAVVSTVESTYHIPLSYHGRRLTVIPLGLPSVDRIPFRQVETPPSEGTKFLYIGRFEARKGILELGEAFAGVARQDDNATLWLVGADNSANDGFAARTGKSYVQALFNLWGEDIRKRVHFFGRVDDAVKNYLLSACDVLVAPSLYESFGLMYVEAMRAGKPVIGSNAGGIPEVVADGATGLLVPPGDALALAMAMLRLGADANLRRALGRQGLQCFEQRFSLYNFGRQTENFYRDVLDDWRGSWSALHVSTETQSRQHNPAARNGKGVAAGQPRSLQPGFSGAGAGHAEGDPLHSAVRGPQQAASPRVKQNSGVRIGIELFGTQGASRHRGIGRYSRNFVATLLALDPDNDYVIYAHDGLPTDQIPTAPNAVLHLLRPDPACGEVTLAHAMERLTTTNPDGLDVLLLLNPLELAPGFDLPAKPLNGLKMVAVVYDLIPLLFQEEYFPRWPGPEFVVHYFQGLNRLRSYDALLAISEATRRDSLSLLGLSPDRVVTIGTASDGRFFVPDRTDPMPAASRSLLRALGITRPFVFSVGSLEYRKNLWGLIEAFAMLPDKLRRAHQLVLTYALSEPEKVQAREYARHRGVADQLVLTDRLSDDALRVLYQRCAAFVFPSLYEGFGLPILEAMHCGAPVIAGNNSSQIEVVGDAGLLFNVADAGELAARLVRVLDHTGPARELHKRAVVQARRYHWEKTARKALDVLTRLHAPEATVHLRPSRRRAPRRRIAFFSPLPPLRSAISDYSARLLDELKRRYTIDVYHDAGYVPHLGLQSYDFGCYDFRLFERNASLMDYHALVYQMGKSPYHGYMYETLLRHPGIVTLHDLGIADFHFWYARRPGVDGDAHIRREFEAFCGAGADEVLRALAPWAGMPGGIQGACTTQGYHLNGRIFEQASAVIVHSPWCAEQVGSRFPAHLGKTFVVPFGATALDPSPEHREAIRARFEIPPEALIIASLGQIHATNMNVETIAAFAPLARAIPHALLIFIGNEIDDGGARSKVMELGLQPRVRFLGHHPAEVLADLAVIADIGVCLRRPPMNGETSGALMDLLRLGVPTIVSDVGSFSCYPDSVVRKHRWDLDGLAGLTQALRELAEDRPRREALGRAAWQYVRQNHTWSGAADSYEEIIERAVAGRNRPQADGGTAAPSLPRIVTSPEWLHAAS